MKIGLCGDIHYSQYSSIIRGRGEKYSKRIENCIASVEWAESIFKTLGVNLEVYLGDFFDTEVLNSEVITSINEIKWNDITKYIIVGNHEMGINTLEFSSSHILNLLPNFIVVDKPSTMDLGNNTEIAFLPYVLESNRKPITEYFPAPFGALGKKKRIMLSHNDISGMQMGQFMSTNGFSIDEIHDNCDIFINGHLHNGNKVTQKIYNIGNLTGQNFSEDAFVYDHCIFVIDTDTLTIDCYENPFAFNFYKLDATTKDIDFTKIKSNSVITLKCNQKDAERYRKSLQDLGNVVESRIIVVPDEHDSSEIETNIEKLSVNHLEEFYKFVIEKLGNSKVVMDELSEICNK